MNIAVARKIVKGYKGVIDLDLSEINPMFHRELIRQHTQDIENYKKYQESLDEHMKYENTVEKIMTDKMHYDALRDRKVKEKEMEELKRLENLLYVHYKSKL